MQQTYNSCCSELAIIGINIILFFYFIIFFILFIGIDIISFPSIIADDDLILKCKCIRSFKCFVAID